MFLKKLIFILKIRLLSRLFLRKAPEEVVREKNVEEIKSTQLKESITLNDGTVVTALFEEGIPVGEGHVTLADGTLLHGHFVEGKLRLNEMGMEKEFALIMTKERPSYPLLKRTNPLPKSS